MDMKSEKMAIDKIYRRRDRYEIPDWQRLQVWPKPKKQLLIDTILRGWRLPKFYLQKIDEKEFEVVDGQQRLLTIFEFFDGGLALSDKSSEEFGGKYYKDLPNKYIDIFDDYEIEYDEIENATDAEIKEFFQRLQEGLKLTSSEKLNSIHSKLRDYLRVLARHKFFSKVKLSDKRYGYFDVLSKVAVLEIEGLDVGLRYDDMREVFEAQSRFSSKSSVAGRIRGALDYLTRAFGDKVMPIRNRTMLQSIITLVIKLQQPSGALGYEKELVSFLEVFLKELSEQVELGQNATDGEYILFQKTINANVKGSARVRQDILFRKLLAHSPQFGEAVDALAVLSCGLPKTIAEGGSEIRSLIETINSRYSSEKGEDLFKATNKTAAALTRLSKPVKNFKEYKSFVDDLYFLFWESVGRRLDGKMPGIFSDIKHLRTWIHHDLDHGKAKDVKLKRIKIGEVFKKYSGITNPETLSPERFSIVQINILGALKSSLKKIAW